MRQTSSSTIGTFAHPWPYASPTLVSNDEVEVLGSQPLGIREYTTCGSTLSGVLASTVTLGALVFDQKESGSKWCLIRHRGFWPLLRMPIAERNQSVVTDDHRLTYTLDVTLEEAIDQYEVWATQPASTVQTTTVTGTRRTMENPTPGNANGFGNFF